MKIRFFIISMFLIGSCISASAQIYSAIGQISSSNQDTFVRDISGDGRLVVLESTANIATENPDNADFNREIFLYDYAQRRIFQITRTKSLLTDTAVSPIFTNVKIEIENFRASISNDGRWIAFSSNANGSVCTPPYGGATTCTTSTADPGNFDANSFTPALPSTTPNPLLQDANTEIYLYNVPAITAVDLTRGTELPLTNLAGGAFTRVTNTPTSRLPVAGSTTGLPIVAEDNGDVIVNDNGDTIAFTSTRDIVLGGNTYPANDNSEIYVYKRLLNSYGQVTITPRGTVLSQIWNINPSISGNGGRVAFLATSNNPVCLPNPVVANPPNPPVCMTGGNNAGAAKNEEVFYADLNAVGLPILATAKQITVTASTTPGDVTNIFIAGRRMSRDGRYIAFDSVAELATGAANTAAIAAFVYDTNPPVTTPVTNPYKQIGPRGNADSAAPEGDILHFPTFSGYDSFGVPQTLVMATRLNIKADGTIPATAADGLNPIAGRPTQTYTYNLNITPSVPTNKFTRVTQLPGSSFSLVSVQPFVANNPSRMAFSLGGVEVGAGNPDLANEGYYLFSPTIARESRGILSFATGASDQPITSETVVDPTPTPTPTPSPTPTPTTTPSPTPSPTPITPPAVQGASPGLLTVMEINAALSPVISPGFNIGSNSRSTPLPIEMNGVSVQISGVACGLRSVGSRQIIFVVPLGLPGGFIYPISINMNGTLIKGTLAIAPVRPDIFTRDLGIPRPLGRANAENATNRVRTVEPFTVRTVKYRGGILVPTVLRVYLTGVEGVASSQASVRFGSETVIGAITGAVKTDIPGRYYIDFAMPITARRLGDVPLVIFVTVGGATYKSRLDDTASRIRIL